MSESQDKPASEHLEREEIVEISTAYIEIGTSLGTPLRCSPPERSTRIGSLLREELEKVRYDCRRTMSKLLSLSLYVVGKPSTANRSIKNASTTDPFTFVDSLA